MESMQDEDRLQRWLDGDLDLHPNAVYELARETRGEEIAQKYFNAAVKARIKP